MMNTDNSFILFLLKFQGQEDKNMHANMAKHFPIN